MSISAGRYQYAHFMIDYISGRYYLYDSITARTIADFASLDEACEYIYELESNGR
jgi:hypothetical protein